MRRLNPRWGLAALALTAAAPASVTVSNPWFRQITPRTPAAGYLSLHNGSDHTVIVTGASSPGCGMLMLHRSEGDRMVMVDQAPIRPGGTLTLAPGGYHLMCTEPHLTIGGSTTVTLDFADGSHIQATAPVLGARDKPPHGGE